MKVQSDSQWAKLYRKVQLFVYILEKPGTDIGRYTYIRLPIYRRYRSNTNINWLLLRLHLLENGNC